MVRVTISYQGLEGVGECTHYPRYEESVESVIEQIERWRESLDGLAPQRAKVLLQTRPAGAAFTLSDCDCRRMGSALSVHKVPTIVCCHR
ncbi:hypothetical protein [Vibrio brasiliensis]